MGRRPGHHRGTRRPDRPDRNSRARPAPAARRASNSACGQLGVNRRGAPNIELPGRPFRAPVSARAGASPNACTWRRGGGAAPGGALRIRLPFGHKADRLCEVRMTVSGDEIAALREHFAAGPDGPAGTGRCSAGPLPLVVTLHTLQLELPVAGDIPMIATEGSAPEVLAPGTVPICGCAAVAADGRMLIGWYDPVDAITRRTQHAEWQAARLGLRLAARYTDGVT